MNEGVCLNALLPLVISSTVVMNLDMGHKCNKSYCVLICKTKILCDSAIDVLVTNHADKEESPNQCVYCSRPKRHFSSC